MPANDYNFEGPNAEAERARMRSDYGMKTDPSGLNYFQQPGQAKNYASPVAFGEEKPEDTTGIFRRAPQWNNRTGKWETPLDWGNILALATGGAMTAGLANAAMAGTAPTVGGGGGGLAGASSVTSSMLPASSITTGGASSVVGGMGGTKMGFGSIIGSLGKKIGQDVALDAAGRAVGAATKSAANNRGVNIDADLAQQYIREQQRKNDFDMMSSYEKDKMSSGQNALKLLQRAQYVQGRQGYEPSSIQLGGQTRQLPKFGFEPKASTEQEQQGAAGLGQEMQKRLTDGYAVPRPEASTPFTIDPKYRQAGLMEKIGNVASIALPVAGLFGRQNDDGSMPTFRPANGDVPQSGQWLQQYLMQQAQRAQNPTGLLYGPEGPGARGDVEDVQNRIFRTTQPDDDPRTNPGLIFKSGVMGI